MKKKWKRKVSDHNYWHPSGSHPLLRFQRPHLQVLDKEPTWWHHERQVQLEHHALCSHHRGCGRRRDPCGRGRLRTNAPKVCPLDQFSGSLFVKDNWFDPLTLFSLVPPSNYLVLPLKRFLSWHRALQGPSTSPRARCFRNYRDTRTLSTTTDANLDCAFVENALLYTDPWFWKVNRI